MKRKLLVLAAVIAACATSLVFATPQTQWEQDQWQVDLGAWNPKAEVDSDKIVGSEFGDGNVSTNSKWNFQGGLTYGLTDKWGLQYGYYGLKTDGNNETLDIGTDGNQHEVNLTYSINKNFAAYAQSQGVPAFQMQLDYKGKTDPVSTNDTDQGCADNRRVDIWQNK